MIVSRGLTQAKHMSTCNEAGSQEALFPTSPTVALELHGSQLSSVRRHANVSFEAVYSETPEQPPSTSDHQRRP